MRTVPRIGPTPVVWLYWWKLVGFDRKPVLRRMPEADGPVWPPAPAPLGFCTVDMFIGVTGGMTVGPGGMIGGKKKPKLFAGSRAMAITASNPPRLLVSVRNIDCSLEEKS